MEKSFLNLPENTVVNKQLPKTQFFKHFGTDNKEQTKFNEDISKIYISNLISSSTVALKPGENIKQFYIMKIIVKYREYSDKSLITIAKNIPQNMIFCVIYEDEIQFSTYYNNRYYKKDWERIEDAQLKLEGLDIEAVWNNCISDLSNLEQKQTSTVELKLSLDTQAQIKALEKKLEKKDKEARKEVQPRQKFELAQEVKQLKEEINKLKNNLE